MGILQDLLTTYHEEMERYRNRPFLEGAMAAAALIATTDGDVSLGERARVDQILETLTELRVYDPHEGVDIFIDFTDAILEDSRIGREKCLEAIGHIADDPKKGALLLRICLAISEADGSKSIADQVEIVSLCNRFGIDPHDCGLYVDAPEQLTNRKGNEPH